MAGLYIHIPFCERKCVYCDFYSVENPGLMDGFIGALNREVKMYGEYSTRETFETIFLGGGTPSLFSPAVLEEVLGLLKHTFRVESNAEITLEANPGTVGRESLLAYRGAGINRLSLGVQSFHQDELEFLGRIHSVAEARQTVGWAQDAGFQNIGIDLIYALPSQTLSRWRDNLHQAVELGVEHISAYGLIIEERTPLARMVNAGLVSPLPTEIEAEMYEEAMQYLSSRGFEHYEVSNYAKPGYRSLHNANYWNHSNYLGFGPSAHSFWKNRRWWNIANVQEYIKKISAGIYPVGGDELLKEEQLLNETILLGVRSNGIDFRHMQERFGMCLEGKNAEFLEQLFAHRLAIQDGNSIRLTDKGFLVCDEISVALLSHVSPV